MHWECESKKCGECLTVFANSAAGMDHITGYVYRLRTDTYGYTENNVASYIRHQLGASKRTSTTTLRFVVAGMYMQSM